VGVCQGWTMGLCVFVMDGLYRNIVGVYQGWTVGDVGYIEGI
jgi:hypothetical protein